jgi:hypothetical protein
MAESLDRQHKVFENLSILGGFFMNQIDIKINLKYAKAEMEKLAVISGKIDNLILKNKGVFLSSLDFFGEATDSLNDFLENFIVFSKHNFNKIKKMDEGLMNGFSGLLTHLFNASKDNNKIDSFVNSLNKNILYLDTCSIVMNCFFDDDLIKDKRNDLENFQILIEESKNQFDLFVKEKFGGVDVVLKDLDKHHIDVKKQLKFLFDSGRDLKKITDEEFSKVEGFINTQKKSIDVLVQEKFNGVDYSVNSFFNEKDRFLSDLVDGYKNDLKKISDDLAITFAACTKGVVEIELKKQEVIEHEKSAAKTVTLLGSVALSDGYSKMSIAENKKAFIWTIVTVVLMGLAASVGLFVLYDAANQITFNLPVVITKIVAALLMAMPSIYTAREASRHRRHSDQFKKISLELAVLTPFISQMSVDKQNEIREALVCKYFVGSQGPKEDDNMPITKEISDKIIDAVSKSFDTMMSKVGK